MNFDREDHNPFKPNCGCDRCKLAWAKRTGQLYAGFIRYELQRARCQFCLGTNLCDGCPNWDMSYAGALQA